MERELESRVPEPQAKTAEARVEVQRSVCVLCESLNLKLFRSRLILSRPLSSSVNSFSVKKEVVRCQVTNPQALGFNDVERINLHFFLGLRKSNPDIQAFMKQMGFGGDFKQLESFYIQT